MSRRPRLRAVRIALTVWQKSAEGIVPTEVGKARTVLVLREGGGLNGVASKRRDSWVKSGRKSS